MTGTRFYQIWWSIKQRCLYKWHNRFPSYWGRWITVCDEWMNFEWFSQDMFDSYNEHCEQFWESNTSIDRYDTNWNYCKENCRWATPDIQQNNRRNNHQITYQWETLSISWWTKKLALSRWLIQGRLKKWFSEKDALFAPLGTKIKKRVLTDEHKKRISNSMLKR